MFGVFSERNLFHHIPDADVIYEERTGREREKSGKWKSKYDEVQEIEKEKKEEVEMEI